MEERTPGEKRVLHPRRGWYAVPVLLFLLGISLLVASSKLGQERRPNIVLPGTVVFTATRAGVYDISYEDTRPYQASLGVQFTFRRLATNEEYHSYRPTISSSYSINDLQGELVAQVKLPAAGEYQVHGNYQSIIRKLPFIIERNAVWKMYVRVLGVPTGLLLVIAGGVVWFLLANLRGKDEERQKVPPAAPLSGGDRPWLQGPPPAYGYRMVDVAPPVEDQAGKTEEERRRTDQ